ncbi:MAG: hypothetical protein KDD69_09145 [Bdellovibrionales bacterium]|nr:hypothetical protein [Bdellovibrionales bacterium]
MIRLDDVAMLLISSNRSKAYLQRMLHRGLEPAHVILLRNKGESALPGQLVSDLQDGSEVEERLYVHQGFVFRPERSLEQTLRESNISFEYCESSDPNSKASLARLMRRPESVVVYSGPGGTILGRQLLSCEKRFLHIHPGDLPEYRGSTTIYYSILEVGSCAATALFLSPEIDRGEILQRKSFELPSDARLIDYIYDPLIRSSLLVEVLESYVDSGNWNTEVQPEEGRTFYIIHPVLKHIAILGLERSEG